MKENNLPFRIETRESFRVVGYKIQTTNQKGEGRKAIPNFWLKMKENRAVEALMPFGNEEIKGVFGINAYNVDENDSRIFDYYIAITSDAEEKDALSSYRVPAAKWAVFPCTLETMGKTEAQAITKWLPKAKLKPLNKGYITGRMKSKAPDIEYYGKDGEIEVWVAIE